MLWLLFNPDETVYMIWGGQKSAYVIKSVEEDRKVLSSHVFTNSYVVYLRNIQFDREFVGRSSEQIPIAHLMARDESPR